MKINGRVIDTPCTEVLVLPRLDGDIVIKAKAVLDTNEFDALCPPPQAPVVMRAGGKFESDTSDSWYKQETVKRNTLRYHYICLCSLADSNIEWDTVDMNDPQTWGNWNEDLRKAGFSAVEVDRVINCILQANSLDEQKLKDAREAFLRGQGSKQVEPSGQDTEQPST
jgi:hypothetical protein